MKFISSTFSKDTGISTVTMQHLGKKFMGVAIIHPEDKENMSEYAGCSYAETRAIIRALKYEKGILCYELKVCEKFVKAIECYAKFNPEDESAKSIYRQLNVKRKKVTEINELIDKMNNALKKSIKDRVEVLNAIKRNKKRSKDIKS